MCEEMEFYLRAEASYDHMG